MIKNFVAGRKITEVIRTILGAGMIIFVLSLPLVNGLNITNGISEVVDDRETGGIDYSVRDVPDFDVFEEPLVTVSFDDGWTSVYENGIPIMERYGIKSTQYVLSGVFDDKQYMSFAQLIELQRNGHHIGSHTKSHANLTEVSPSLAREELAMSQIVLERKLNDIEDFAAPYGAYDDKTVNYAKKIYRSHRTTDWGINTNNNFDPYRIRAYTIYGNTTLSEIENIVKEARNQNGWAILVYHKVDKSGETYSVTPAQFAKHMRVLSQSDIKTPTVDQVMDDYYAAKR